MTARVTLHGRNHTHAPSTSSLQDERAYRTLLPMAEEFTGRRKAWSWLACLAVGAVFWTAVFAGVMS